MTLSPGPDTRLRTAVRSAPPRALLLPGLAGSPAIWRPFAQRAGTWLEIETAAPPWVGPAGWAYDTDPGRHVLDAVRALPRPPDLLVAHSFAATLVLDLISRGELGEPVALVLVSPFYRPTPAAFDWRTIAGYLNGFHTILDEGLRVGSGGRLADDVRRAMARQVRERVGPYGWVRFFDLYLRTPFMDLARVDAPLLVITGDRDFAAGADDGRTLARAVPGARFELFADCGHFAMAEQPDRFAALLHEFVETL
ncbi:alpha/beta fold hydrolase [Plantactinospora sonchi]|uniref:Alpha/beta fold hydrolase n=1 Tax=Plantactinospora sonchi TaxID=1544735 RepID=A0ABU7RTE4_9ACTN